jgi:HEPN domain-containing protein
MKKNQNSLYPEDWKVVARKDWGRAKRNLNEGDAEAAGFFLQQALEKYLKAFLLERDWELQKLHTLSTLLDYALEYNSHLERFRILSERVTDYYFVERYPRLIATEITPEDIEDDMEEAKQFIRMMFPEEKEDP